MGKVLVVDDSYAEMQMLESILKGAQYSVMALPDANRLEDVIAADKPDVIVLDVVMPGRNGFQVCRDLKNDQRFSHIPIVFCTSKGQESDRFWGRQQGANAHVVKPFKAQDLLSAVKTALESKAAGELPLS
jgi:twitching motility two-component system response regulator PilH